MPIITPAIIGANVLVFVAMGATGAGWFTVDWQKAVIWGADYWPLTTTGQWWRLVTAAFVHFGLNHLLSNMLVLAVAGIVTERLYGKRMYALIYLYGAVASSLASRWWHQTGAAAGASGAVFAVIGAMLVYLIVHRRGFARRNVMPIIVQIIVMIGSEFFFGARDAQVDNAAHLGGLASGILIGLISFPVRPVTSRPRQARPRLIPATAVSVLTIAAATYAIPKEANCDDICAMAYAYYAGDGVPKSYSAAMKWYLRAAQGGNSDAMFNVGVLFQNGQGVLADQSQALSWYRKAAEQGDVDAMDAVAAIYQSGTSPNYQRAMPWLRKAAEKGDIGAMVNLGVIFENGSGVPKDSKQAMDWFWKAEQMGDATAMYDIGVLYYNGEVVDNGYGQALQWFEKAAAADHGLASAFKMIGMIYENGLGVKPDLHQAADWYGKAAAAGDQASAKWIADHPQGNG